MTQKVIKPQGSYFKYEQSSYNQTITEHGGKNIGHFQEVNEDSSQPNDFENDQNSIAMKKLESMGGYS